MNFYLPFTVQPSKIAICYDSQLLFLGSCFSDVIGCKCKQVRLPSLENPFGTLFNSRVIQENLIRALNQEQLSFDNVVEVKPNYFQHYGLHSSVYAQSPEDLLKKVAGIDEVVSAHIRNKPAAVFITLGTAWVYELNGQIVANCHKQPQQKFSKRLMTKEEVVTDLQAIYTALKEYNAEVEVIFTISPVRHIKDGLFENNVSKGILHQAVHTFISEKNDCFYFPAYEIVVDQLRDYRFYKSDLIHPSEQAEDFVWQQFLNAFCKPETLAVIKEVTKIIQLENHKPLFPDSLENVELKTKISKKKESLTTKFNIEW